VFSVIVKIWPYVYRCNGTSSRSLLFWMSSFKSDHCRGSGPSRKTKVHGGTCTEETRARIFKHLWSPGTDSKEPIPPGCVAWRAGTTTLFLLSSHRLFKNSSTGFSLKAELFHKKPWQIIWTTDHYSAIKRLCRKFLSLGFGKTEKISGSVSYRYEYRSFPFLQMITKGNFITKLFLLKILF